MSDIVFVSNIGNLSDSQNDVIDGLIMRYYRPWQGNIILIGRLTPSTSSSSARRYCVIIGTPGVGLIDNDFMFDSAYVYIFQYVSNNAAISMYYDKNIYVDTGGYSCYIGGLYDGLDLTSSLEYVDGTNFSSIKLIPYFRPTMFYIWVVFFVLVALFAYLLRRLFSLVFLRQKY